MKEIKKGDKLNHAIVLDVKENRNKNAKGGLIVYCICECGKLYNFPIYKIKQSCGCFRGNFKYFGYDKKLYSTWRSMKNRCFWEGCPNYSGYGGRGITVCAGMLDFNIYQQVLGSPPTRKHSVDREDNNMNYSCGECSECKEKGWIKNVRWATSKVQNSNKRNNILVEIDGAIMPLKYACLIRGLPYKQIHERIVRGGWDKNIAINTPINKSNRYKKNRNETTYRKNHRSL